MNFVIFHTSKGKELRPRLPAVCGKPRTNLDKSVEKWATPQLVLYFYELRSLNKITEFFYYFID